MPSRGLSFLDEASEKLGDPSISAGASTVRKPKPIAGLRSASDRFEASAKFLEGSGRTQKFERSTGLPGGDTEVGGAEADISKAVTPKKKGGGFVSFTQEKKLPSAVANFGLPTDRLPSIEELGGALGGIAKYVSQLTKRNRARGLSPGTELTKTVDKGAAANRKTTLDALIKLREGDILSGNKEGAAKRAEQIDAIIAGESGNAFAGEDDDDAETILGL